MSRDRTAAPPDPPAPPPRPGLLYEGGEPMKAPWEAQEIDVSVKHRQPTSRAGFEALGDALSRLPLPPVVAADRVVEAADPDQAEADRRDHLIYLQRWVGPSDHSRAMVERARARVDELKASKKAVPPALTRELAVWTGKLADAEERDQIQATRPEGCWCLGLGGRDETRVVILDPDNPSRVLFSDAEAGTTWQTFCDCPEGQRARSDRQRERDALRDRGMGRRAHRLLGGARIPVDYAQLDLRTYPDQDVAGRVERWYLTNLGELASEQQLRPFLLLSGPNRRGKTGLAIGVVKLALARQIEAVFRTMPGLLDELSATFDKDNPACHAELLDALKQAPLLVLDDMGAQRMTDWRAETIYSLLNHRAIERKLTLVTTNLGWRDTHKWNPQELLDQCGERVFWRIRSASNHLPVTGPVLGIDQPRRPEPAPKPDDFDTWT
jgi:DNA replication protein DnaC